MGWGWAAGLGDVMGKQWEERRQNRRQDELLADERAYQEQIRTQEMARQDQLADRTARYQGAMQMLQHIANDPNALGGVKAKASSLVLRGMNMGPTMMDPQFMNEIDQTLSEAAYQDRLGIAGQFEKVGTDQGLKGIVQSLGNLRGVIGDQSPQVAAAMNALSKMLGETAGAEYEKQAAALTAPTARSWTYTPEELMMRERGAKQVERADEFEFGVDLAREKAKIDQEFSTPASIQAGLLSGNPETRKRAEAALAAQNAHDIRLANIAAASRQGRGGGGAGTRIKVIGADGKPTYFYPSAENIGSNGQLLLPAGMRLAEGAGAEDSRAQSLGIMNELTQLKPLIDTKAKEATGLIDMGKHWLRGTAFGEATNMDAPDPDIEMIRNFLGDMTSNRLNQLSGAAISPMEYQRLRTFLPTVDQLKYMSSSKLQQVFNNFMDAYSYVHNMRYGEFGAGESGKYDTRNYMDGYQRKGEYNYEADPLTSKDGIMPTPLPTGAPDINGMSLDEAMKLYIENEGY